MIIAIDGPAGSGKGTLSRRLSLHYGLSYLDTGKLYRAVGFALLDKGFTLDNLEEALRIITKLSKNDLSNPLLRTEKIGQAASTLATNHAIRGALLAFQRNFAQSPQGAILDGRDIGTIICPQADIKLFITASVKIRAERRLKELIDEGHQAIWEQVLQEMQERDDRDRNRSIAPLVPSVEAIVIDTTLMSADEAFEKACQIIDKNRMKQ
jgi:cytidylate kinase